MKFSNFSRTKYVMISITLTDGAIFRKHTFVGRYLHIVSSAIKIT